MPSSTHSLDPLCGSPRRSFMEIEEKKEAQTENKQNSPGRRNTENSWGRRNTFQMRILITILAHIASYTKRLIIVFSKLKQRMTCPNYFTTSVGSVNWLATFPALILIFKTWHASSYWVPKAHCFMNRYSHISNKVFSGPNQDWRRRMKGREA